MGLKASQCGILLMRLVDCIVSPGVLINVRPVSQTIAGKS